MSTTIIITITYIFYVWVYTSNFQATRQNGDDAESPIVSLGYHRSEALERRWHIIWGWRWGSGEEAVGVNRGRQGGL